MNMVFSGVAGSRPARGSPYQMATANARSRGAENIAFSSESLPRTRSGVGTGSREENASKQEIKPDDRELGGLRQRVDFRVAQIAGHDGNGDRERADCIGHCGDDGAWAFRPRIG